MPQHAVARKPFDHLEHLGVVGVVVLLLGAPALKVPGPELGVAHLVDGEDGEIHLRPPAIDDRTVLGDGVALHPQLKPALHGEVGGVALARRREGGEVARVIDVHDGLAVHDACERCVVGIGFHAVVDVVGEADFVQVEPDRVAADVVDGVPGVVAEFRVDMVVGKHGTSSNVMVAPW